jgi:hypothetical protein
MLFPSRFWCGTKTYPKYRTILCIKKQVHKETSTQGNEWYERRFLGFNFHIIRNFFILMNFTFKSTLQLGLFWFASKICIPFLPC